MLALSGALHSFSCVGPQKDGIARSNGLDRINLMVTCRIRQTLVARNM